MKKIIYSLIILPFVYIANCNAEKLHCDPVYKGKPFNQVTIWGDPFGPAQCFYKDINEDNKQMISYDLTPKGSYYYPASKNWRVAFPGYDWCGELNGGTFDTCLFAKREMK